MTQALQAPPVNRLEFGTLIESRSDSLSLIVKDYGKVYVTSITRDGCSGCAEQKPLFQELATRLNEKHPGKVAFSNLHVQYSDDVHQSEEAKRMFHHGSYPTYMIHVRSQYGPLEHYRAAYPTMEELEKQIIGAFELSEYYAGQAQKPA